MMTDEQIARYEDAGFSRWTKRDMDRLYIDTTRLGLECDLKRDHEPCLGDWQGKRVSDADCRRIYFSKVWVDVRDGSLHVASDFQPEPRRRVGRGRGPRLHRDHLGHTARPARRIAGTIWNRT
jgi:hypothetical protein